MLIVNRGFRCWVGEFDGRKFIMERGIFDKIEILYIGGC